MLKAIEIISSPNENKLKESVVVSSAKQKKTTENIKKAFGNTRKIIAIKKEKAQNNKNEPRTKKIEIDL